MKDVQYFKLRSIEVKLLHQAMDGHVRLKVFDAKWQVSFVLQPAVLSVENTFGILLPSWDLQTCNNHLVAFIDRARVLAEAYGIKGSLPTTL